MNDEPIRTLIGKSDHLPEPSQHGVSDEIDWSFFVNWQNGEDRQSTTAKQILYPRLINSFWKLPQNEERLYCQSSVGDQVSHGTVDG